LENRDERIEQNEEFLDTSEVKEWRSDESSISSEPSGHTIIVEDCESSDEAVEEWREISTE